MIGIHKAIDQLVVDQRYVKFKHFLHYISFASRVSQIQSSPEFVRLILLK